MTMEKRAHKAGPIAADATGFGVLFQSLPAWMSPESMGLPFQIGTEMLRFTARRLEAQAELWSDLSRCASLPEMLERQTAFARKGMSAYTAEVTTLIDKAAAVEKA